MKGLNWAGIIFFVTPLIFVSVILPVFVVISEITVQALCILNRVKDKCRRS